MGTRERILKLLERAELSVGFVHASEMLYHGLPEEARSTIHRGVCEGPLGQQMANLGIEAKEGIVLAALATVFFAQTMRREGHKDEEAAPTAEAMMAEAVRQIAENDDLSDLADQDEAWRENPFLLLYATLSRQSDDLDEVLGSSALIQDALDRLEKDLDERLEEIQGTTRRSEEMLVEIRERVAPLLLAAYDFTLPSPHFVGREETIAELARILSHAGAAHIAQAIAGIGGVGKTQVARRFADLCYERASGMPRFAVIQEVSAASETDLLASFRRVAVNLGTLSHEQAAEADLPTSAARVEFGLARLEGQWLLLVDNLDAPGIVRGLLPKPIHGCVLITSRAPDLGALVNHRPVTIDVFEPAVARDFLLARAFPDPARPPTDDHRREAAGLAKELGLYALSLEQAAAAVGSGQFSLRSYRVRLREIGEGLPPDTGEALTQYERSSRTTFAIAFERLSLLAQAIVDVAAWLDADSIPVEGLRGVLLGLGIELPSSASWPALFPALRELRQASLITTLDAEGEAFGMHRVAQVAARSLIGIADRPERLDGILQAAADSATDMTFEARSRRTQMLPHWSRLAEHAERVGLKTHAEIRVLALVDWQAWETGLYGLSLRWAERGARLSREVLGERHPDTLTSMNNLAGTYSAMGRHEEALGLCEEAVAGLEIALGRDHPHTVIVRNNRDAVRAVVEKDSS